MIITRDFQRSKVYKWERSVCPLYDKSQVPFENIQAIVDYVWKSEGLEHPPVVKALDPRKSCLGNGWRSDVGFHPNCLVSTCVILHELAHSLSSIPGMDMSDETNGHCEDFMGCFIKLLDKYAGIPLPVLLYTANKQGVKYNLNVKPWFIDQGS